MQFVLEEKIRNWKAYLRERGSFLPADLEELESHLRDEIDDLSSRGLDEEEAFFIGIKRLGKTDDLSREFYKQNAQSLWKHLFAPTEKGAATTTRDVWIIIGFALLAGLLAKIPHLLGYPVSDDMANNIYLRNFGLFFIPVIGGWIVLQKKTVDRNLLIFASLCLGSLLAVNLFPFTGLRHTELLAGIHLPILLWLAMERLYSSGQNPIEGRMNYITFSGEFFIYSVLCVLGGGVFIAFTAALFDILSIDPEYFLSEWVGLFGAMGVPVVAVFLVEKKKALIENMAPVLAKIFTPMFLLLITGFLIAVLATQFSLNTDREILILFDLLLVLVLALVLYSISARPAGSKVSLSDYLVFFLIVVALLADIFAMGAILSRLSQHGASPNRIAALGENVLLFANLLGLSLTFGSTVFKGRDMQRLERWQSYCFVGYMVWMAVVVFLFPLFFRFA